jgi:hypothetical protein
MPTVTTPEALLVPRTRYLLLVAAAALSAACSDLSSPDSPNPNSTLPRPQALTVSPATNCPAGSTGTTGTLDDGSLYEFCVPAVPLGLVLYGHGYVQAGAPLAIVDDEIPVGDGSLRRVSEVVNSLGFVFGTTSYPHNGLNGSEGVASLSALKQAFTTIYGPLPPGARTYLVGVSEGALLTSLAAEQSERDFQGAAEQSEGDFQGALSACGPVGDFRSQVNYFGDFRVLFDYFFPGVLGPAWVDDADYGAAARAQVAANWGFYQAQIIAALAARPLAAAQLISVAQAPINPLDLTSVGETVIGVLWYNIFATDDAALRLSGRPFDNRARFYTGSFNDLRLNRRVKRFTAQRAALATIQSEFQTTGRLQIPVVTDHTLLDPIVRVRQEVIYAAKVARAGESDRLSQFTVPRYGHCAFTVGELQLAFGRLVQATAGPALAISGATVEHPALRFGAFALLGRPMAK